MAKKKLANRLVATKKPKAKKVPKAKLSPKKPQAVKKASAKKSSQKPPLKIKTKTSPKSRSSSKSVKGGAQATSESLLKVGELAPAFSAPNENGEIISSDSLHGHILKIYPKILEDLK